MGKGRNGEREHRAFVNSNRLQGENVRTSPPFHLLASLPSPSKAPTFGVRCEIPWPEQSWTNEWESYRRLIDEAEGSEINLACPVRTQHFQATHHTLISSLKQVFPPPLPLPWNIQEQFSISLQFYYLLAPQRWWNAMIFFKAIITENVVVFPNDYTYYLNIYLSQIWLKIYK